MSRELEEGLLRRLIEAEERGSPLTHAQLGRETCGSMWEDLWANMYIVAVGQENKMVSVVGQDTQYVASAYGKWYLAKLEAERRGETPPPAPPPRTVQMF